jgi:eukaryotic-like serine/threonine-protein kinase
MAEEQKYKILNKLDVGGMAEVFVAESESMKGFKKRVAIKRILPHLSKNQKFVQMFLDEAKLCLQLEHANIVNVFDIGKADAAFFIVMEYVEGTNLKKVIESYRRAGKVVPIEQSIYVLREVCEGLAYAHDSTDMTTDEPLGLVHRDVSPPNILLSKRGEIKLVDFGLAKATSQLEETDPGVVKGKFSYLSPEAASGISVDMRADIFSVGILLYEMLTGQRLFYGENDYHTVELVRKAEIPPISSINPQVPPEMEEVITKALAKDPDDRYQHASEFSEDLTRLLFSRGMPVSRGDVSRMVGFTLKEQKSASPATEKRPTTIIDALIQEEILKFTSLDDVEEPLEMGAKPLSPDEISVLDPGDFIDPRGWATDLDDKTAAELAAAGRITDRPPDRSNDKSPTGLDISSHTLVAITEHSVNVKLPTAKNTSKSDKKLADHRKPSPRPKDKKGGLSAVVWVLLTVTALAAVAAALVAAGVVQIPSIPGFSP